MSLTRNTSNTLKMSTLDKALAINLAQSRYGTFAEIGAGQEVVRYFFQAGGASGTIAKSMSAYDMTVSDSIYGKCQRYVSAERLQAMLDYEYSLNLERLSEQRGDSTAFFAFADTVSARNFSGTNRSHGWMGVKFQSHPRDQYSQVILHLRLLDTTNQLQQEALGITGVNLLYGCFFHYHEPEVLLESLKDNLSTARIEIDYIEFSGIEFRHVDNMAMALRLVQLGLSKAALFAPNGKLCMPSEAFYKKPILVERGSFHPVCNINIDIIESARKLFAAEENVKESEIIPIMELTMNNLMNRDGQIDLQDFLLRAEMITSLGYHVLISDYFEYYRLAQYLRQNTEQPIGLTMGGMSLITMLEERFYNNLEGGVLEAMGRLFKHDVRLYIYPIRNQNTREIIYANNLNVSDKMQHLYLHLLDQGHVVPIVDFNEANLDIFSREVVNLIRSGSDRWEAMVPPQIVQILKSCKTFR